MNIGSPTDSPGTPVFWDQLSYPVSQFLLTLEIPAWKPPHKHALVPFVPEMTYNVSSGTLNPAIRILWLLRRGRAAIGCRPADDACWGPSVNASSISLFISLNDIMDHFCYGWENCEQSNWSMLKSDVCEMTWSWLTRFFWGSLIWIKVTFSHLLTEPTVQEVMHTNPSLATAE